MPAGALGPAAARLLAPAVADAARDEQDEQHDDQDPCPQRHLGSPRFLCPGGQRPSTQSSRWRPEANGTARVWADGASGETALQKGGDRVTRRDRAGRNRGLRTDDRSLSIVPPPSAESALAWRDPLG